MVLAPFTPNCITHPMQTHSSPFFLKPFALADAQFHWVNLATQEVSPLRSPANEAYEPILSGYGFQEARCPHDENRVTAMPLPTVFGEKS